MFKKKLNGFNGNSCFLIKDILKRQSDLIFRWGGEEFVVLISNEEENYFALAEKIRIVVENYNFSNVGRLTISCGVTKLLPNDTKDSLLIRADKLLYKSKNEGRNKTSCEL